MGEDEPGEMIERREGRSDVADHEALDFLEDMLRGLRRVADAAPVRQDVRDDLRAVHDKVRAIIRN